MLENEPNLSPLIKIRMKRFFLQHLHFTRLERMGSIALLALCILLYALPAWFRYFRPNRSTDFANFQADIQKFRQSMPARAFPMTNTMSAEKFAFDPNTATLEDFLRLGLPEKTAQSICNYRNKGGQFRKAEDFKKIYSLKPEEYERLLPYVRIASEEHAAEYQKKPREEQAPACPFDPNTADESLLRRLGLASHTVKSILNYRSKGGVFRKKEDLQKIYTLSEADYQRLEPYIAITALAGPPQPVQYAGGPVFEKKFTAKGPLDINRAAVEDWERLPGIGEKRARQFVKYRESLGGFLSVAQLRDLYGLPDSVFQRIKPMVTLEFSGIRTINLNAASADDLDKHPYISAKQAKLVVNYREQHGPYQSVEDLGKIIAFSDKTWLEKIRPYLSVQ